MKIQTIALPTPLEVGDVNVYLIAEDPVTLIDVGPKTRTAAAALQASLRQHNLRFADVRRIVLTHAHEDHCGLAKQIRDEAKNTEILIHPWETGHLFGRLTHEDNRRLMARAGVPDRVFAELQGLYETISRLTDRFETTDFSPLSDEMELEFETGALRVLHTPGHTPGSCSFVRPADRTIICGDTVLKRITPNPVLAFDPVDPERRFRSLGEYLVSLARLRALAPTLVLGGHGEPVTDFEEIFHRYVRSINERQSKVISLTTKTGATAWELAQLLFPTAINEDVHRFLAISETIAHLDYAVEEGQLAIERRADVEFYRRTEN